MHPDFLDEKTKLEQLLNSRGHICYFIPKFHCELNPIERAWAQAKRTTRAYCNYSIVVLRKNIPLALDSITLDNVCKYFNRVKRYMYSYLEGHNLGGELESRVKAFKKTYGAHRRIGMNM